MELTSKQRAQLRGLASTLTTIIHTCLLYTYPRPRDS